MRVTKEQIIELLELLVLARIDNLERKLMGDFTALNAEVANNTALTQQAIALIQNPPAPPDDQPSIDAATATLTANDAALAAAITPPAAPAAAK